MLMPNATDELAGRDLHLARPGDLEHGARHEAYVDHRLGQIRRMVRSGSHLMAAVL